MIEKTDSNGVIYRASPQGRGFWYISWPGGGFRFFGSVTRLKEEMRYLMESCKTLEKA